MKNILGRLVSMGILAMVVSSCATIPGKSDVPPSKGELTILSYNLWHDQSDWPARLEYMLPTLKELNPDVTGLQEVIQREHLENQAITLGNALQYEVFFSTVDPEDRAQRYGNAILSRHPILESNMRKLRPLNDYRTAAHVVIEVHGVTIDVYNTHLHHTRDGRDIRSEQIADMLDFIRETRRGSQVILLGDFNSAPDWPELEPVHDAYLDTFAAFVEDSLSPVHTTLNPHVGLPERRIDFVFLENVESPNWKPTQSEIILDQPSPEGVWASDHFGVLTRFSRTAAPSQMK
ncbi:MAG: endonuclease/exonuclease/phosphatase family protein [Candidatus Sumerlaeia bacterium]|nr:endonuclease/exonuclease/phosphatase family protein [Candidatus Sumerlaeia bacterium]